MQKLWCGIVRAAFDTTVILSKSESEGGIEASSEIICPLAGVKLNGETYDMVVENYVNWFPVE